MDVYLKIVHNHATWPCYTNLSVLHTDRYVSTLRVSPRPPALSKRQRLFKLYLVLASGFSHMPEEISRTAPSTLTFDFVFK